MTPAFGGQFSIQLSYGRIRAHILTIPELRGSRNSSLRHRGRQNLNFCNYVKCLGLTDALKG